MKIGILIPIFDRPQYLKDCLWSMERLILPPGTEILLIDDSSTDLTAKKLFSSFVHPTAKVKKATNEHNKGIKGCLLYGYEYFFSRGVDLVINFDSDAIIRHDAVEKLVEAHEILDNSILTGFHCTTKNANGTERHEIVSDLKKLANLYMKKSVGGINFCVNKKAYTNFVKPALTMGGNWDHNACILGNGAMCLTESVVQHIGFNSSMGHHEQPDVADDFYYWHLPDVTLIGADNQPERLRKAADICTKWIKFGDVKLLSPDITSKEQYSKFCIEELYKHVDTSHMLVFQHDGYVHDWQSWDNDWLQYDYIGAPWYYVDGMDVGNGGFSLRSKKLMQAVSEICEFHHPEDHHICRTYRKKLEAMGFKFAPVEVAEKFSFEGYMQPHKHLSNQFGKHGNRVVAPSKRSESYVVNQYRGLGDILFLMPLIRSLMAEGNSVLWPIVGEYMNIAKHFPDINFVDMDTIDVPYQNMFITQTKYGRLLPYRFAMENMGGDMRTCMSAKYSLFGHDYKMWRQLYWQRDKEAENSLKTLVGATGKYQLVNRYYGEASRGMFITPNLNPDLPVIEMSTIDGYSLIDWCGVIEGASEIHTANTSINYILEIMNLPIPVYLYKRGLWGEVAYEHTAELWTNKNFIYNY